ncbi:MAG: hypothetical protein U9N59_05420 [Campylobacterota bacterium]|nr:hypothetical protein [Campylobacterota bacterium]
MNNELKITDEELYKMIKKSMSDVKGNYPKEILTQDTVEKLGLEIKIVKDILEKFENKN